MKYFIKSFLLTNKTEIFLLEHYNKIFLQENKIFIAFRQNQQNQMVVYLNCSRGSSHEGEKLNIVCLNQACFSGPLCCNACIDEYHQGHKTKFLEDLIHQAQQMLKKGSSQLTQKQYSGFNGNLLHNMVLQQEFKAINKFKLLKFSIISTLDQIQQNMFIYFKQMKDVVMRANQTQNIQETIQHSLQIINSGVNFRNIVNSIQKIILQINKIDMEGNIKVVNNSTQSITALVAQSNKEVLDLIDLRFTEIRNVLSQSSNYLFDSIANINTIWEKPLFYFHEDICHPNLQVLKDNMILSQEDDNYQMALMYPQLSYNHTQVFRFKITKLTGSWLAVGMAHKNILSQKKYRFHFKQPGHGAYMISANGGTWSHSMNQLNNKVKAFTFQQGDVISCIVDNYSKSIFFVRQIELSQLSATTREVYQLPFTPIPNDPLHPCVTLFYPQNEVEYLPATNNSQIPNYQYTFTQENKHYDLILTNNKLVMSINKDGYKSAVLNKTLQYGIVNSFKRFSFRIVRCSSDWVAVGMCYKKIAADNNYEFNNYEDVGHGYYMISSNGGSWSHIDAEKNNIIRSFKFEEGATITCQVEFGDSRDSPNNRIIFKKGIHKHILNFKTIQGYKLYPCVMLYYAGDQVNILPNF